MSGTPKELYEAVAAELAATSEAQQAKMFGMPGLKAGGKAFGGFYEDSMVFKLAEPARSEALALQGSKLFDPLGGRPMEEWVQIPAEHAAHGLRFARDAMNYVVR